MDVAAKVATKDAEAGDQKSHVSAAGKAGREGKREGGSMTDTDEESMPELAEHHHAHHTHEHGDTPHQHPHPPIQVI